VTKETDSYEYEGNCVPFTTVDAGKMGANGSEPEHEVYFKESVHGPISGTVKVGGNDITEDPVAAKKLIGYLPENAPAYATRNRQGGVGKTARGNQRDRAVSF